MLPRPSTADNLSWMKPSNSDMYILKNYTVTERINGVAIKVYTLFNENDTTIDCTLQNDAEYTVEVFNTCGQSSNNSVMFVEAITTTSRIGCEFIINYQI